MEYFICIVIGALAGVSSGVFGIGGGILIVPALILAFGFTQQKAQGTSLASLLLPVGILAVINYHKSGNANLWYGGMIGLGYLGGALMGSNVALSTSSDDLRRWFGVFMVALGLWFIFKKS
jgi:uncharacterized membrane protein YfcA